MRLDRVGALALALTWIASHAVADVDAGPTAEAREARAAEAREARATGSTGAGADSAAPRIPAFSGATDGTLPEGWQPLEFPKIPAHTRYELVEDDGVRVVRATSVASASGLVFPVEVDLRRHPILRWRWKVAGALERGDVTSRAGDDYPARVYVTFRYDPDAVSLWKRVQYLAARQLRGELPIAALTYIWASRAPVGTVVDNAYAGGFVKMVVVQSGTEHAGTWRDEVRNVYEDYVRAFGEEPPLVNGIAIMSDTDGTGESMVAHYGDLAFEAAGAAAVTE